MSRQLLRECHVNCSRECHVSRNATWMIGRDLSLFAETSVSSRLGACVPSRPRALTKDKVKVKVKAKVKHMVGPIQGIQGGKSTG